MEDLRVTCLQNNIVWEDKAANRLAIQQQLCGLAGKTDLVVLPEMFTTGFTMNSHALAEPNDGETVAALKNWASAYNFAITGSFIASENGQYFNRGFFVTPDHKTYFYDKHHLFRMGEEGKHFSAGDKRLIVNYHQWNICLMICYDLRFPVWCRNVNNGYDLLIFTASWPHSRIHAWDSLLVARAIENTCYVCGCNRVGEDGTAALYSGHSMILDFKGYPLAQAGQNCEDTISATLNLQQLGRFREKFPTWRDADPFDCSGI